MDGDTSSEEDSKSSSSSSSSSNLEVINIHEKRKEQEEKREEEKRSDEEEASGDDEDELDPDSLGESPEPGSDISEDEEEEVGQEEREEFSTTDEEEGTKGLEGEEEEDEDERDIVDYGEDDFDSEEEQEEEGTDEQENNYEEEAEEEEEEDYTAQRRRRITASRASIDSQRSVSYFVDFNAPDLMTQSAILPRSSINHRSTPSSDLSASSPGQPDQDEYSAKTHVLEEAQSPVIVDSRMTQSMYVGNTSGTPAQLPRSESRQSQLSGISFFVDFSSPPASAANSRSRIPSALSRKPASPVRGSNKSVSNKPVIPASPAGSQSYYRKHSGSIGNQTYRKSSSPVEERPDHNNRGNQTYRIPPSPEEERTYNKKSSVHSKEATQRKPLSPIRNGTYRKPSSPGGNKTYSRRKSSIPSPTNNKGHSDKSNAFFKQIKNCMEVFSEPCHSKDQVRQRKRLAEKLSQLMLEEEEKLANGQSLSNLKDVEHSLQQEGNENNNSSGSKRPVSAYYSAQEKPVLRRERTFDLDPGTSARDVKVVEISLDDSPTSNVALSKEQRKVLQAFQTQRGIQAKQLKKEVDMLDKIEWELAMKTSACGPEPVVKCWGEASPGTKPAIGTPTPKPRPRTMIPGLDPTLLPQRPARRCDSFSGPLSNSISGSTAQEQLKKPPVMTPTVVPAVKESLLTNFTTFATSSRGKSLNKDKFRVNIMEKSSANSMESSASSACSWFIPNEDETQAATCEEKAAEPKSSLFRQFKERKDCHSDNISSKKKKPAPQAYFISCDDEEVEEPSPARRSSTSSTKLTGSKKNGRAKEAAGRRKMTDSEEEQGRPGSARMVVQRDGSSNLQEALMRRRPDYIAKTKGRESTRMAKKIVSNNRNACVIVENISTQDYARPSSVGGNARGTHHQVRSPERLECAEEDMYYYPHNSSSSSSHRRNSCHEDSRPKQQHHLKETRTSSARKTQQPQLPLKSTEASGSKKAATKIPKQQQSSSSHHQYSDKAAPRSSQLASSGKQLHSSKYEGGSSSSPFGRLTSHSHKKESNSSSPYCQSKRSLHHAGQPVLHPSMPRVALQSHSREIPKRKENGVYRTNKTMSMTCSKSSGKMGSGGGGGPVSGGAGANNNAALKMTS